MQPGLGITNTYLSYGVDSSNLTRIDYLNNSIVYDQLPSKWINGIPYTCFTSTNAFAEHTCVYTSASKIKIALLL